MIRCAFLFSLLPVLAFSYTTTITLNDINCDVWSSNDVYSDSEYLVKWTGKSLTDTCKIMFDNHDTDRRICVKATSYYVSDCNVRLRYYGGLLGDTFQNSYSCFDDPNEYCADTYDDLSIKLDTSTSSSSSSHFTLRVYSKSYLNPVVIGVSVSAAVIFTMSVFIVVLILVRRRRNLGLARSSLLTSYPPPTSSIVTSNVSSGITNPNYPGYNQPPPPPYTQYPYGQTPYSGTTSTTSTVVR